MLHRDRLKTIKRIYQKILLHDIVPFWIDFSLDRIHGGYYHYLDRDGSVLNHDKSVWLQNRSLWFFSKLYNEIENRDEWLEAADIGFSFITDYCFDHDGRMFFTVDETGRKLRKRRYWFTETFGVLGLCEYAKASGNSYALELAQRTYEKIVYLYQHPNELSSKTFVENRSVRGLAPTMLLMSTTQVVRESGQETEKYNHVIDRCIEDIRTYFLKEELHALLETVSYDGSIIDTPEGRTINPGHSIETAWFLMQEGLYRGDTEVVSLGLAILKWSFERGWDDTYGGIFSFVDIYNKPSEHVEWDMKYWWPHTETLYALLLAYITTEDESYLAKYEDIHVWTFKHFPDYEYGEWYGYLHRDGSIALPIKGSNWKGTFHIPRMLIQGMALIDKCLEK